MTEFHSEWCSYHAVSPDALIPGCRCTQLEEDGISFVAPEPLEGTDTFLGRTVLLEAVALLFGLTPLEVHTRLTGDFEPPIEEEPKKRGRAKKE